MEKANLLGVCPSVAELTGFLDELRPGPKLDFELNRLLPEPSWELPKTLDGGGPAGVKERAEEGGGPAGVVEGWATKPANGFPCLLDVRERESGVDGGLEDSGTVQPDMMFGYDEALRGKLVLVWLELVTSKPIDRLKGLPSLTQAVEKDQRKAKSLWMWHVFIVELVVGNIWLQPHGNAPRRLTPFGAKSIRTHHPEY